MWVLSPYLLAYTLSESRFSYPGNHHFLLRNLYLFSIPFMFSSGCHSNPELKQSRVLSHFEHSLQLMRHGIIVIIPGGISSICGRTNDRIKRYWNKNHKRIYPVWMHLLRHKIKSKMWPISIIYWYRHWILKNKILRTLTINEI